MTEVAGAVAVLASSLFAGAAVYINLVEHPARLSCGTEVAARQWAPSYKRAAVMQVSVAVLATLAGLARWLGYLSPIASRSVSRISASEPSPPNKGMNLSSLSRPSQVMPGVRRTRCGVRR